MQMIWLIFFLKNYTRTAADVLYSDNEKWGLTVSTLKTKNMVFRNGGKLKDDEEWFYNGVSIDVVNQFTYLGILLSYNIKFAPAIKCIFQQEQKTFVTVKKNIKTLFLNYSS